MHIVIITFSFHVYFLVEVTGNSYKFQELTAVFQVFLSNFTEQPVILVSFLFMGMGIRA